jgi:hypothetical protein
MLTTTAPPCQASQNGEEDERSLNSSNILFLYVVFVFRYRRVFTAKLKRRRRRRRSSLCLGEIEKEREKLCVGFGIILRDKKKGVRFNIDR